MSTPLQSPRWSPWAPSTAQALDGTKMGGTGNSGSTSRPRSLRSVRSVEILPAIPEDVYSGRQVLPAESPLLAATDGPVVPPSPSPSPRLSPRPSSSRRTATPPPMPSPTVTEILAMSGVHGASARDSAVRDLAHLLRQSRAREEALRVQLSQTLVTGSELVVLPDTKDLVARLASTEALLLKKEAELREYRAQGLTLQQVQDPNDAEGLLSAFDELNARVKLLAQRVRDSLGWSERSTVIDRETLRRLRARNPPAFALVRHFLSAECAAGRTLGDVTDHIARALLSAVLCDLVFMPFAPGCDPEEHEAVCALFKRIAENESQERSARWRASTYRALRAGTVDAELLDYIVKTFFQTLYDVLSSAARGSAALRKAGVFSELRGEATGVARAALRWRDDAADRAYEAFCPWPLVRLGADEFRANGSPYAHAGHVVMLATSLGLRTIQPPSAYKPHTSIAVRASEGLRSDIWSLRKLADDQTKWETSAYAGAFTTYRTGWATVGRY